MYQRRAYSAQKELQCALDMEELKESDDYNHGSLSAENHVVISAIILESLQWFFIDFKFINEI